MGNEKGFTLIEIITSIAILVLVLMVFLPVFPQTMQWTKDSEAKLVSGHLLGRVAHDVRTNPAVLSLDTMVEGSERVLTGASGDLVGLPAYNQDVTLTIVFDDAEGMYRVHIQAFKDGGKLDAETYVYLGGDGA